MRSMCSRYSGSYVIIRSAERNPPAFKDGADVAFGSP
jgi:hypothetical protein